MARVRRHTTFCFTIVAKQSEASTLARHAGASRVAYNQGLRLVRDALEAKKSDPTTKVPWSGFDLINEFNAWKRSPDDEGRPKLPWRHEVCQQVFEEAVVDLGRGLDGFTKAKRGERKGKRVGFPRFKKKGVAKDSFRIRNKTSAKGRASIRVGDVAPRSVALPKIGTLVVREDTRRLRRMLRNGRAKILFATVSRQAGRWTIQLNVEAAPLHPKRRHQAKLDRAAIHGPSCGRPGRTPLGRKRSPSGFAADRQAVGIDRGLSTFAVVANAAGEELARIDSPRPLRTALPKLRRQSRALSRKQPTSRNRHRQKARVSRLHRRIANVRRDFVHRASSRLVKTHDRLVIEDLCTAGLLRTRLARSIADSAWARFGTMLKYKAEWYGAELIVADRFYPSSKRCSACASVKSELSLSERTYRCEVCGHEADRDLNAAACLAQWSRVAAKHAETINVCGEGSADATASLLRETAFYEAGRASARRPRRAVFWQETLRSRAIVRLAVARPPHDRQIGQRDRRRKDGAQGDRRAGVDAHSIQNGIRDIVEKQRRQRGAPVHDVDVGRVERTVLDGQTTFGSGDPKALDRGDLGAPHQDAARSGRRRDGIGRGHRDVFQHDAFGIGARAIQATTGPLEVEAAALGLSQRAVASLYRSRWRRASARDEAGWISGDWWRRSLYRPTGYGPRVSGKGRIQGVSLQVPGCLC